jgi:predicted Zn-dependent peptidase
VNLVIRAGSGHEDEGESGAAHFLEHMLFRGSQNHSAGEVEAYIEGLGGAVNAGTLRDFTHFYAIVPKGSFEESLQALADAVLYPTLDSFEIERERGIILREITRHQEGSREMLWDLAHRALFSEHPYGRPVQGSSEMVFNLGRESLIAFHHRWYVPNNMALIIVGDVSEAEALMKAKETFGGVSRGPIGETRRAVGSTPAASREQTYYHAGSVAYVGLAVKAPGISSPRSVCAMDVVQALLAEGKTSRLQVLLREEEPLAMGVGAEYLTSREPSPFLIWAACRPDKVAEVQAKIEEIITSLRSAEIDAAEIAAAKRRLETAFWLANETYTDQADMFGFAEAIDSYRFAAEYTSRIRAISPAEVKRAAQTCFSPQDRVWLLLLPAEQTAAGGGKP